MSSSCRSSGPSRPARSASLRLAVAASGLALLAGCAIGVQDRPVIISVNRQTAAPIPSPAVSAVPLSVQVYLLKGAYLYRVTRTVPPGPGLAPALAAISAPLSPDEQAQGLRTALPASVQPLTGDFTRGDTARVQVPAGFDRLPVQEQINLVGQLVFTITADTLATGVQLMRGGKPAAIPDATGQLLSRPVTREDYAVLTPRTGS